MLLSNKSYESFIPKDKYWFKRFLKIRSELIAAYENGTISKREFLRKNVNFFNETNMRPFFTVNSLEKGIFNYQYYNSLAKRYYILARQKKYVDKRRYNHYLNLCTKHYDLKDRTILAILEYIDYDPIEAYYIETDSKELQNKLYEIILLNQKEAIFHSKANWLKQRLIEKGKFKEGIYPSIIDGYINEKY